MKKSFFTLFACCFFFAILNAQNPTQTISGQVMDKETLEPLIGASVSIKNAEPVIGSVTDMNGRFSLKNVPIGRLQVQCAYVGYEPWLSEALIVNSARETVLSIALSEGATNTIKELVVTASKRGNEPINELSLLSTRSFSVDETQRYAASANDPSRMAMGFPGVQPSRDSRSDIVVRGNSSIGLLWRLEGVEIPNPNHFARRGSSGGGITVFSVSMLANSDFSTGAFPAEYGNAYSGVFDIHFRKGNPEKREYTFRAGMLGLDFSTEGPFRKRKGEQGERVTGASYLVNYRYSTLGILNKLGLHLVGERIDNTFQDLSFNLYFPSKNKKHIVTLWGIGGLSQEQENAVKNPAEWKSFNDYYTRDFNTNMGALGATYTVLLKGDAYVKTNFSIMRQDIYWRNDTLAPTLRPFAVNTEQYKEDRQVLNSFLSKKFSRKLSLKTGITLTQMPYHLQRETLNDSTSISAIGATQMIQPYANFRIRPTEKLTFNAGLHVLYFALNKTSSIEPRFAVKYQCAENQSISLAWGIHGRVLPLGNYFTRINGVEVNRAVDLIRAQHYVAGWDLLAGESMRLHAEVYFQQMKDVPVAKSLASSWSILNTISGFTNIAMVNTGKGQNIGLDMSVEKSFDKGAFFLLSASLSQSH